MSAKTQVNSKMLLSAIKLHPLYKQIKGRSKMKKAELIKAINKLITREQLVENNLEKLVANLK